jgi:hypothetical protein
MFFDVLSGSIYDTRQPLIRGGTIIGHGRRSDECFLIIKQLNFPRILSEIGNETEPPRFEYHNVKTLKFETGETLHAIEGYRFTEPRIEYAFFVQRGEEWYMYCSSLGLVTPLSEPTYNNIIGCLTKNGIEHEIAHVFNRN